MSLVDSSDSNSIAVDSDDVSSIPSNGGAKVEGVISNKRKRIMLVVRVLSRSTLAVPVDEMDTEFFGSSLEQVDDEGMKCLVWYIADFGMPSCNVGSWQTWTNYQKAFLPIIL